VPALAPGFCELNSTRFAGTRFEVSCLQHMGDRRTQEDRFLMVPRIEPGSSDAMPLALFGVFDGTVGDFASDNVKDIFLPALLETQAWRTLRSRDRKSQGLADLRQQEQQLEMVFRDCYPSADNELLARCSKNQQHYATCTSVTMLVYGDYLMFGHLGDSRIVIGKEQNGKIVPEEVTKDHKPDLECERKRIEECGGMVERLVNHKNKPFIRGGDFTMRKALGEQPMQLMYSRAFGAKDLKVFGLSHDPDVKIINMRTTGVKYAILASDGLWDVISAQQAIDIVQHESERNSEQNPSAALVRAALLENSRLKAKADNITAVCIKFD